MESVITLLRNPHEPVEGKESGKARVVLEAGDDKQGIASLSGENELLPWSFDSAASS